MKTIQITLFALIATLVFSCKNGSDDNTISPADAGKLLIGKTWIYSDITGKVNYGAVVTGNVTVYKDGKNQYGFAEDLSKAAYVFKEGGKVDVFNAFLNRYETMNWEISSNGKQLLIWEGTDKDWGTEWEIKSITEKSVQVMEKDWSQAVTDHKLTTDTGVLMDVTITLVPKS